MDQGHKSDEFILIDQLEKCGHAVRQFWLPINTADFSSFLLQAQGAKPDVIVLANAGADAVTSLKQATEFGLTSGPNAIKMASLLAMINDIEALGLEFARGVVVYVSFYWDMNDAT